MDGCWGGFLPCLLYYSISSGTLVDLTKLHDWHFINIYLKNILCIFVSLLAPFPPSLWLFPVQKKKMLLLIFVHLILSTPLQNVSHVVFLTLKKSFCFYTPQLTGALLLFLHCQTSRKQYALPIFTASSLTDTSAPCKLNFLLSLSHSLKCPRYISLFPN